MHVLIPACLALAAIVGSGQLLERRRRRRITEMIAARGGKVLAIKPTTPPSWRRTVRYIGPQGELREALVSADMSNLCDDRPFQIVLREKYQRARSTDMLPKLILATEIAQLPGSDAYKAIVLELAAGSADSVSIDESPSDVDTDRRFAPVLQCIEAASISSEAAAAQILQLVANGKNIDLHWSLEGESPHRSLVIRAVRPQG